MPQLEALNRLISLVEETTGEELDASTLNNRIKIQKLVYFAQEFGVDLDYRFNMYVHGPYSPALAKDYYDEDFGGIETTVTDEFDMANFFDLVEGKSEEWLELATTAHKLYQTYKHSYSGTDLQEEVIDSAAAKKNAGTDEVRDILSELSDFGLLS